MTYEEYLELAEKERAYQAQFAHHIQVCSGTGCVSSRSADLAIALEAEVKRRGLENEVAIKRVGCMGLCAVGPVVSVAPEGTLYQGVEPADATDILDAVATGAPVERLRVDTDIPFFYRQEKNVTEHFGKVDPERIEDYIALGGYSALNKAINDMSPAEIIQEVVKSGLRGRGGGGFPTGLKWATVAKVASDRKYVVCNADEGDPGAFMDRSIIESNPNLVLEGIIIAAYALGASEGVVYIRTEYSLAIKRLRAAIRQAERLNFLGNNICGTPFSFKIDVRLGAGAFVCGEETALIHSIEGERGMPHPRPPFPAERGLWDKPTLINNVETFANIPSIITDGGEWFARIGSPRSRGTKVFALTGQITNTGLIEVPMGARLREIVYEIGGGLPDGRKLKAVQTGGPSGACIPEELLDTPVDYESLKAIGAMVGSGGLIVIDDSSNMIDVAKYFVEFSMAESCGKCIPCRVGTAQLHALLEKFQRGEATEADLTTLEDLCDMVKNASLCGLGQSAPNPVISTLQYFRQEYLDRIQKPEVDA